MNRRDIAIIALCDRGRRIARTIAGMLPNCTIYVHRSVIVSERSFDDEISFDSVITLTAMLFQKSRNLVFVLPAGVAVRAISPLLHSKLCDPAVVVVDVGGRWAISLLSGHEGGANALALRVSNAIAAEPVISTSTEAEKTLIVGIGCRRNIMAAAIVHAIEHTLLSHQLQLSDVRMLATADVKRHEIGIVQAASQLCIPLRVLSSAEIRACLPPLETSAFVMEKVNLPGVAEPAALLAGRRTSLLVSKQTYPGITVAVARENCTWSA